MKLTGEQIEKVENYLTNKDVEYIDLHLEVLDHISSDIETTMDENQLDFNEAFEEVKLKWNKTFSYKWTYWLGISNGGSKLFIDNCLKIYKPLFFKSMLFIILIVGCFYGSIQVFNIDLLYYKQFINTLYVVFSMLYVGFNLFWYFQIKKTTIKSTFSYLFNKQIFPNIYLVLFLFVSDSFNSQEEFKYSKFLMFSSLISILVIGNYFYKSHLKAISNYKKYQLK